MRDFLILLIGTVTIICIIVFSLDSCSLESDAAGNGPILLIDASQADVSGNGQIDVLDLLLVAQHSGTPVPPNPCAIFDRSGESGHPVFIVIPQEQIDLLASGALRVVRECLP